MTSNAAITTLRELLRIEAGALLPHLARLSPWVGRDSLELHDAVTLAVRHRREAMDRLSALLGGMGATPPVLRPPGDHAAAHYLTIEHLLPRLVRDLRRVVEAYESADPRGESIALERIRKVAADDLEKLETLLERADA